jgi:hypothetical protein
MGEAFYVNQRLPGQVFRKPYTFTLMTEYSLDSDVLKIVQDPRFCDREEPVLLSVLDPDPVSYFHKRFGKINSFRFSAKITDEEYTDLLHLNPGNYGDAVINYANVVVWLPERARWAMWGEAGREITVIGFDDPAMADFLLNDVGYWFDAETALEVFAGMPYSSNERKAPEDFARPLIKNYGSRAELERKLVQAGVSLPKRP